tara:strand:- start:137521 stop:138975 length:1455 start_codon:yes stop_codon:yes gene_type:complete
MHKTLIIVDDENIALDADNLEIISFDKYVKDYPKLNEPKTRIINLCDTEHYLSKGYYCSLLAEAREHIVLPSVKVVNELRVFNHEEGPLINLQRDIGNVLHDKEELEVFSYFGWVENPLLQKLGKKIFNQYPAPILYFTLSRRGADVSLQIKRYAYSALNAEQAETFQLKLNEFVQTVWRVSNKRKPSRWDMAILINPQETVPPSNKEAIARFIKAAGKHGIAAETITAEQFQNIGYYDALFIRETTAIDHHTYRLASRAENLGLVVIDDPVSILRCCNKVYLHDAFSYQKVPSLFTKVINNSSKNSLDEIENSFSYPLVLKMPEGSFSRGVFKVSNRKELKQRLNELFAESALVLAQEYLYTEFDWRIGVLNGRAIYACRYLMARNHWQIYNHSVKKNISGGFETLPTFEVPKKVLDAAVKAAKFIGDGLYGVDVKEHENYAYVIEVNDNPSIDHDVEDQYLGDELYMLIMSEFQRRLEQRGR